MIITYNQQQGQYRQHRTHTDKPDAAGIGLAQNAFSQTIQHPDHS